MCHVSMKLCDKSDPNQMYTSDKIVVKHISLKETLLKLDLESKGQGYSKDSLRGGYATNAISIVNAH